MDRISSNLPNDNMQFYMRERSLQMNDLQNKLASQQRIQNLRDDPAGAAHATRYQSFQVRLERFAKNAETVSDRNQIAEGHMRQAVEMLQRAREIAIQGANGTYSRQDLEYMSMEVNEILEEMVQVANARGSDGTVLFGGDRSEQLPFRAIYGIRAGGERSMITDVEYTGTINPQYAEIGEGNYIQSNFAGNQVFWAENQQILSRVDAQDYQVNQDGSIFVDGTEISLREGDTVYSIIQRINESDAMVKASLDPVYSGVVLETTSPHQIWLQDGPNSSVLQDLGLISGPEARPPANRAPDAQVAGGSVFNALVALRDELASGDQIDVGGKMIAGIDRSLDNMLSEVGRLGAVNARLASTQKRIESEIPEVMQQYSRITDVDFAEAITDLKQLEYTHQAALGAAARIIRPSLLDFLR